MARWEVTFTESDGYYEHTFYITADKIASSELDVHSYYGEKLYTVPVIVADGVTIEFGINEKIKTIEQVE